MISNRSRFAASFLLLAGLGTVARGGSVGPTAYLGFDDSPFKSIVFDSYFYNETFEDHLFNVPGAAGSSGGVASVVFGPSIHDSVDGDDGTIDGSGLGGDSYFTSVGALTFTFYATALGELPTHAGLVWTDGVNPVTFNAYDGDGNLLGSIGPNDLADGSFSGTTAEDRFLGWTDSQGIGSISIVQPTGGIEIDHLQYGRTSGENPPPPTVIPLPPAALPAIMLLGSFPLAQILLRRSQREKL